MLILLWLNKIFLYSWDIIISLIRAYFLLRLFDEIIVDNRHLCIYCAGIQYSRKVIACMVFKHIRVVIHVYIPVS